ncbi:dihydrofolate reductase family protein [Yinghuangia soli]|uniref:Dihydrofolate reductase family protein n=1 Tax=Yinghuangia soli TaxID=2908204 RepID=A0AA41Q2H3_9ACTN|nr:dihydrofolate reductase family protein [Yinghuangia soli]MCF2530363.1 dihydrofolate reductase family protein [Yinghuangia soli]
MRIAIGEFISLDGIVQAPGHPEEDTDGGFAHGGWSHPFFDPEIMGAALGEWTASTDALLFGRRTWQVMAAAWPDQAGDPMADHMNSARKFVVSDTLTQDDVAVWQNTTLIPGTEAVDRIKQLREEDGRDLTVMGSATLSRLLIAEGLVDELRLMVMPVLLGGGKSIYPTDGGQRPFELISTTTTGTGVLICTYRPAA